MPLPTSIQELLDTQKVNYSIAQMDERMTNIALVHSKQQASLVQSVLLQDSQGRVQVLLPGGTMVDLEALQQITGRHFEGVNIEEIKPLMQEHDLTGVPAVPRWQGMPTLVDESLLKVKTLWLDAGGGSDMLEISQQEFRTIIKSSDPVKCSVRVPDLAGDPSSDEGQIFDSVKRFTQKRIKQRLDETLELPPLPETAQRIIKLRADPNADINDLANIVEIDPSLAAQVVSWAASPYYSAPGKIKSVHDAIVRVLGFDMVLNLALGLALGKTMSMRTLSPLHIAKYWRGAVYTAAAVEGLVTSIDRENRPGFGMAYLSGLLNNFGYLIMAEVFPPYFTNIEKMAKANPHVNRAAIESHMLGVTGNQVASWLMDNWNMPQEIVVALSQQHNPTFQGEFGVYAKLVHVAQTMLGQAGFGDNLVRPVPLQLFTDLKLDPETAKVTIGNLLESGDDLDAIAEKMRG
ncbi:aminoacyl-tRNA deacylase and HDOD domain-containing protein [Teredinibacter franksiae]|uniref:aminoacyl-tRNA deacylase and HDOD domain-containing protein n=1 Tax=Teredinibacter franksiae TaxID=2761453 RepID=UPI001629E71C|nr:HDOD domain-containing protein [Teredinibacter franksiae]